MCPFYWHVKILTFIQLLCRLHLISVLLVYLCAKSIFFYASRADAKLSYTLGVSRLISKHFPNHNGFHKSVIKHLNGGFIPCYLLLPIIIYITTFALFNV